MRHRSHMPTARLTYRDYLRLPDDGLRYEILDGRVVVSPPAGTDHQAVLTALSYALFGAIQRRSRGRVFTDLDCEITAHDIVRPDVLVVLAANKRRITKTRVLGTPDLVVEILSPRTASRDRTRKRRRYEAAGTPELWLVDRARRVVVQYVHDGAAFGSATEHRDTIRLHSLPDVEIDLRECW